MRLIPPLTEIDEILERLASAKEELDHHVDSLLREVMGQLRQLLMTYGVPDESLISLARNMVDTAGNNVAPSMEWIKLSDFVSSFGGHNEDEFTYELARALTGVRLEDWLDQTRESLRQVLKSLRIALQRLLLQNFTVVPVWRYCFSIRRTSEKSHYL